MLRVGASLIRLPLLHAYHIPQRVHNVKANRIDSFERARERGLGGRGPRGALRATCRSALRRLAESRAPPRNVDRRPGTRAGRIVARRYDSSLTR